VPGKQKVQKIKLTPKGKMETSDKQEIKNLIFTYRDALNASDVSKVLLNYTEDYN